MKRLGILLLNHVTDKMNVFVLKTVLECINLFNRQRERFIKKWNVTYNYYTLIEYYLTKGTLLPFDRDTLRNPVPEANFSSRHLRSSIHNCVTRNASQNSNLRNRIWETARQGESKYS